MKRRLAVGSAAAWLYLMIPQTVWAHGTEDQHRYEVLAYGILSLAAAGIAVVTGTAYAVSRKKPRALLNVCLAAGIVFAAGCILYLWNNGIQPSEHGGHQH